jgi:RimJ/RimL family protein N-acetyltransferase
MINYSALFDNFPKLESSRIILDKFSMYDYIPFLEMCNEVDYNQLYLNPGTHISPDDARQYIEKIYPENFSSRTQIDFAVKGKVNAFNSFLIGERTLFIDGPFSAVETQGYIREGYRDQGVNQEVLFLIESFLKMANVRLLKFNCKSDNKRVIHYADKLGYTTIGIGRTSYEFAKRLDLPTA